MIEQRYRMKWVKRSETSTWPTNILPATLKVSVGEVSIVSCKTHEICVYDNHMALGYSATVGCK